MARTRGWFCVWAPIPFVLLAVALIDWLHIPAGILVREPWLALTSAGVAVSNTAELMWRLVVLQVLIGLIPIALPPDRARGVPLIAAVTIVCGAMALVSYLVLVGYHAFAGYAPFIAAWCALWVGLSATYATALIAHRLRAAMAIAAIAVVIASIFVNSTYYPGQYPTLHAALWMVTCAAGHAGATAALSTRPMPRRWVRIVAPAVALAAVAALGGALTASSSRARSYARAYTAGGRYEIFRGHGPPADQCLEPVAFPDADAARSLFDEHAHLPALPEGFRIDDHNLLLIMVDAVRFDDTTFGGKPTTPNLARFAADGAFVFERAYSPSARTTITVGSMFDMTYPSHARMRTLVPPWVATLADDVDTPAELFAAAGYTTFRFNHQFPPRYLAAGLFQGFAHSEELPLLTSKQKRAVDPAIADATVAELERLARTNERFFGLVFFIGPHHPYLGTEPRAPTARGRYRQDLLGADEHIGRVLDTLRSTGLLDTTVVIFMADHGEEFGEHGLYSHGMSLFDAATHVPMLLWIPGLRGRVIAEPTSATYVWPWLAATGTDAMRSLAGARIREHFAPMLAATDGAVVTELNDWDQFQTALVWRDARAIYDFQTGLYQVYDLAADPGETRNIVREDPDAARPYIDRLDRYRNLRACQRRVTITPDRAPSRRPDQ